MAYANSADPDQTAPEGAVWSGSTLFAFAAKYVKKKVYKKQNLGKGSMEYLKYLKFYDIYRN